MSGTGFTPGYAVTTQECALTTAKVASCDYATTRTVTVGFHGEFTINYPIRRVIAPVVGPTGPTSTDCATTPGACELTIQGTQSQPAITIALTFDPNVPAVTPTVTAAPSTGLTDNESITVSLQGFTPNQPVQLIECSDEAASEGNFAYCDYSTGQTTTPTGPNAIQTPFVVHAVLGGQEGLVDCTAEPGDVRADRNQQRRLLRLRAGHAGRARFRSPEHRFHATHLRDPVVRAKATTREPPALGARVQLFRPRCRCFDVSVFVSGETVGGNALGSWTRSRVALVIAGVTLTLVPLTGSASAIPVAQCSTFEAPPPVLVHVGVVRIAKVAGCNSLGNTPVSGRSVTSLETHINTTTWSGGMGTTIVKVHYGPGPKPNDCPPGTHLTLADRHGHRRLGPRVRSPQKRPDGGLARAAWGRRTALHARVRRGLQVQHHRVAGPQAQAHTIDAADHTVAADGTDYAARAASRADDDRSEDDCSQREQSSAAGAVGGRTVGVPGHGPRRDGHAREPRPASDRQPGAVGREREPRLGRAQAFGRDGDELGHVAQRLGHRDQRIALRRGPAGLDRTEHRVDDRRLLARHHRVDVLQRGRPERRAPPQHPEHQLSQHRSRLHRRTPRPAPYWWSQDFGS